MATKQEIAESLTVEELRSLASENGIDLSGTSNKADIVDAVVAGTTKEQLEAYASDDAETTADTSADELPAQASSIHLDPEAAQKAGMSAADLELSSPQLPGGEPRIIKSFPERQNALEVDVATEEQPGSPVVAVTVTDGEGGTKEAELAADDAARLATAVHSSTSEHPANTSPGHWSNPNLHQWGDDEEAVKANEEAYAKRTAS